MEFATTAIDPLNGLRSVSGQGRSDRQTLKRMAHEASPCPGGTELSFEFRDLDLDERGRCRRALVDGRPDEPIAPKSAVV